MCALRDADGASGLRWRQRRRSHGIGVQVRFEITTPATTDPTSLALSPDGTKVVFAATSEGRSRLVLHSLEAFSDRALAGTEDGYFPFWSSDSRSLGFFAGGR